MFFGAGAAGCHAQLPRLAAQGRHEEVVTRAGRARISPRGASARAWARSLVALDRSDEARAVLLRDFRKHAELPSLIALADLEAAEGRVGVAAAHYARAASLEVDPLAGRTDVCGLFRRRGERFWAEGEALAADLDLRRVAMICPKGKTPGDEAQWRSDRALHDRVIAAAKIQARAQRTLRGCEEARCQGPATDARTQALAQALVEARAAGPARLRAVAAELSVSLSVNDVAGLLAAELRGELGVELVSLDELRGWIGEANPVDMVTAVDSLSSVLGRDYARLRLAQLGDGYGLPGEDVTRSTASAVIRLLEAADADPAAATMAWRVFVLLGDLPSAEMALTASLGVKPGRSAAVAEDIASETGGAGARGGELRDSKMSAGTGAGERAAGAGVSAGTGAGSAGVSVGTGAGSAGVSAGTGAGSAGVSAGTGARVGAGVSAGTGARAVGGVSAGTGAGEPAQRVVPAPELWSARGVVDGDRLPRLLQLARLRGAAGRRDQGLAIAAWALAEGQARGLPGVAALAAGEARHELAAGRPWAALALTSVVTGAPTRDVERAAGSALVLERAGCGERCGDAEDRAAVMQMFGETWLLEQEKRATESAFARAAGASRGAACPLLAESLAPEAGGELASALRLARDEGLAARALPEALRRAVESDLTLDCAGRVAVPLMYAIDARVAARVLADNLAHAPQEVASGQLAVQSELALVLGRRDQADQLAIAAAAASADPRRVWRRAEAMGQWIDARHYELLALRQLLLHGTGGAEAEEVRMRLVVRGLRDADEAWAPRNAEAGREALIRGVTSHIAEVPPSRRWHAREALALALAEYAWADETAAGLIRAAVWPDPSLVTMHPGGYRRLERALGGDVAGPPPPPLAPAELAAHMSPRTGFLGAANAGSKDMSERTADEMSRLPGETEAFCSVEALQAPRLAALHGQAPGDAHVRAASAIAVTGDAAARKQALQSMLAGLTPARRAAVLEVIIAGLAAAPTGEAAPMVVSDDDLLAIVFGLVRDPRRRPREIKGQGG